MQAGNQIQTTKPDPLKIRLTSTEMAHLWETYTIESLVHEMQRYYLTHIQDPDIQSHVELSLETTGKILETLRTLFRNENFPIPRGITSDDLNLHAPRLFSDNFYILYNYNMSKFALVLYTLAYTEVSREDIRLLYEQIMSAFKIVHQKATEILLTKGLYVRPPYIPLPQKVDFVKKQNFLTGFFGNKRRLSAMEITHLFMNAHSNALGKALMSSFSQVVQSKEIRDYFLRGKKISNKYFHIFTDILVDEDVSAPPSFDGDIMDTTESPFSDRLMLFHVVLLISTGFGKYGMGLAASPRRDLGALYGRILAEVATYAEDGANLIIDHGWMEQPPLAPDRDALAKSKKK